MTLPMIKKGGGESSGAAAALSPSHYKNACHPERSDSVAKELVKEPAKPVQSPSAAKDFAAKHQRLKQSNSLKLLTKN